MAHLALISGRGVKNRGMFQRLIIVFLFLSSFAVESQTGLSKAELLLALQTAKADTSLIDIYNELSWPIYSYDNPDSAVYYSNLALQLAERVNDTKRLSIAHRRIGIAYINNGEFKKSILHQEESYQLSEKINFHEGKLKALNNLGVIYLNNDLLDKALSYFLKSLKLAEDANDFSVISNMYNNCGLIYIKTQDYKRAEVFFRKAIQYSAYNKNPGVLLEYHCNLSAAFRNMKNSDSAKFHMEKAVGALAEDASDKVKYACYTAKALYYSMVGKHQLALESFLDCINWEMTQGDRITLLINIAEEYQKLNKLADATVHFQKAFQLSGANKSYNNLMYLSYRLAQIYESQQNFKTYAKFMNLHLSYRDSNEKYVRVQHIKQQQLEFDFERKQVADSLKFAQREELKNMELEVAASKLNREKIFRVTLLLLLGTLVLLTVFIYNRFFVTRKQNRIIAQQKEIVDLKNKEILDSINYAKRLQSAILPALEKIKQHLDVDILYLPKDIIGGDFYFFEERDSKLFLAVCDCTGHGVPGAIMSVVCHQALKKSIHEFGLNKAHDILNQSRQLVIEQLRASEQNIQDGMDCSLIVLDTKQNSYSWAGAYNPLWIWANGTFIELKADKQPVAFYENAKPFTEQIGKLLPNTLFCLFSDGYPDQFGGEKGKKFKQKQLKEEIEQQLHLSTQQQVQFLTNSFMKWKGKLDQVDDVSLALFKV